MWADVVGAVRRAVGAVVGGLGFDGTLGVLAVLAVAVAFGLFARAEREAGARAVLVQLYADSAHRAARRADSLARVYRVDTVTLHRLDRVFDTVWVREDVTRLIDSVRALHVPRPDTVRVSVPLVVLTAADSDVRACRATVADCERRADALAAQLAAVRAENAALRRPAGGPGWGSCIVGGAGVGGLMFAALRLVGR